MAQGAKMAAPFGFLKIPATPSLQRRCAEIYADDKFKASPQPL